MRRSTHVGLVASLALGLLVAAAAADEGAPISQPTSAPADTPLDAGWEAFQRDAWRFLAPEFAYIDDRSGWDRVWYMWEPEPQRPTLLLVWLTGDDGLRLCSGSVRNWDPGVVDERGLPLTDLTTLYRFLSGAHKAGRSVLTGLGRDTQWNGRHVSSLSTTAIRWLNDGFINQQLLANTSSNVTAQHLNSGARAYPQLSSTSNLVTISTGTSERPRVFAWRLTRKRAHLVSFMCPSNDRTPLTLTEYDTRKLDELRKSVLNDVCNQIPMATLRDIVQEGDSLFAPLNTTDMSWIMRVAWQHTASAEFEAGKIPYQRNVWRYLLPTLSSIDDLPNSYGGLWRGEKRVTDRYQEAPVEDKNDPNAVLHLLPHWGLIGWLIDEDGVRLCPGYIGSGTEGLNTEDILSFTDPRETFEFFQYSRTGWGSLSSGFEYETQWGNFCKYLRFTPELIHWLRQTIPTTDDQIAANGQTANATPRLLSLDAVTKLRSIAKREGDHADIVLAWCLDNKRARLVSFSPPNDMVASVKFTDHSVLKVAHLERRCIAIVEDGQGLATLRDPVAYEDNILAPLLPRDIAWLRKSLAAATTKPVTP